MLTTRPPRKNCSPKNSEKKVSVGKTLSGSEKSDQGRKSLK